MHLLRCIAAEWLVVRARLVHTRLGMWLVLLAAAFAWAAPPGDLVPFATRTGLLAGVLCIAFAAGAKDDQASLRTSLSHPTSPVAIAAGRWAGATIAAALAVTAVAGVVGARDAAPASAVLDAWLAGVVAAAGAAACALPAVLVGGNTFAALLIALAALPEIAALAAPSFIYVAGACVAGGVPAAAGLLGRRR